MAFRRPVSSSILRPSPGQGKYYMRLILIIIYKPADLTISTTAWRASFSIFWRKLHAKSLSLVRSCGREAEGGGLLNRYTALKPYRGFESLRLRQFLSSFRGRTDSTLPIASSNSAGWNGFVKTASAPRYLRSPDTHGAPRIPTSRGSFCRAASDGSLGSSRCPLCRALECPSAPRRCCCSSIA